MAKVKGALTHFGIAEDLKTSGYCTYAHRTGRKGIIDGYEYGSWGTVKVERERYDVGAIWRAFSECGTSASLGLSFELSDERAAEEALIGDAVSQARRSADALARAAGMLLGGVNGMRYQRAGDAFNPVGFDALPPSGCPVDFDDQPDFDPEPVEIECHVDVDWLLRKADE